MEAKFDQPAGKTPGEDPSVSRRLDPMTSGCSLDGIYCEPGHETALYELMEGVLERENHYLASKADDGYPVPAPPPDLDPKRLGDRTGCWEVSTVISHPLHQPARPCEAVLHGPTGIYIHIR